MGIKIGSNFNLEAKEYLDSRSRTATLDTLKSDYNITNTPDGFEVFVLGLRKWYQAKNDGLLLSFIERPVGLTENFANTDLKVETPRKHSGPGSVEFEMPVILSNESVRINNLTDKSSNQTFNRLLVQDPQGNLGFYTTMDFIINAVSNMTPAERLKYVTALGATGDGLVYLSTSDTANMIRGNTYSILIIGRQLNNTSALSSVVKLVNIASETTMILADNYEILSTTGMRAEFTIPDDFPKGVYSVISYYTSESFSSNRISIGDKGPTNQIDFRAGKYFKKIGEAKPITYELQSSVPSVGYTTDLGVASFGSAHPQTGALQKDYLYVTKPFTIEDSFEIELDMDITMDGNRGGGLFFNRMVCSFGLYRTRETSITTFPQIVLNVSQENRYADTTTKNGVLLVTGSRIATHLEEETFSPGTVLKSRIRISRNKSVIVLELSLLEYNNSFVYKYNVASELDKYGFVFCPGALDRNDTQYSLASPLARMSVKNSSITAITTR